MFDALILDLTNEYLEFKRAVKPILDRNYDDFAKETIKSILEYIHGANSGWDLLQEFADELQETAEDKGLTVADASIVRDAALKLGQEMLTHLKDVGAYDAEGSLGFKFKEIMGTDIVLMPLSPEDLAAEDDELDVSQLENPNKIADDLAERDQDNLYSTPYDALADSEDD